MLPKTSITAALLVFMSAALASHASAGTAPDDQPAGPVAASGYTDGIALIGAWKHASGRLGISSKSAGAAVLDRVEQWWSGPDIELSEAKRADYADENAISGIWRVSEAARDAHARATQDPSRPATLIHLADRSMQELINVWARTRAGKNDGRLLRNAEGELRGTSLVLPAPYPDTLGESGHVSIGPATADQLLNKAFGRALRPRSIVPLTRLGNVVAISTFIATQDTPAWARHLDFMTGAPLKGHKDAFYGAFENKAKAKAASQIALYQSLWHVIAFYDPEDTSWKILTTTRPGTAVVDGVVRLFNGSTPLPRPAYLDLGHHELAQSRKAEEHLIGLSAAYGMPLPLLEAGEDEPAWSGPSGVPHLAIAQRKVRARLAAKPGVPDRAYAEPRDMFTAYRNRMRGYYQIATTRESGTDAGVDIDFTITRKHVRNINERRAVLSGTLDFRKSRISAFATAVRFNGTQIQVHHNENDFETEAINDRDSTRQ